MSAHTPGPWHKKDLLVYAPHEHKGRTVNRFSAWVFAWTSQGGTFEEADANAHLIAAAPDLLEALNRFDVEDLELDGDEEIDITMTAEDLRILRAAIAKAKGGKP